jgi:CheY-like chemotaxis protein
MMDEPFFPALRDLPRGTETLLLVEDEDGVRALAQITLRNCGYTLLEAANGREALDRAAGHAGPIHLLVTDVVMPHLGGRELAEQLRAARPGLLVLYLSGYTNDEVLHRGVAVADEAFLQKPYTPSTLAAKVREVLDQVRR